MSRYVCERCKAVYHVVGGFIDGTKETEHLCPDLKVRWARREKQRDAVLKILDDHFPDAGSTERNDVAEEIVMTLVKLQINLED